LIIKRIEIKVLAYVFLLNALAINTIIAQVNKEITITIRSISNAGLTVHFDNAEKLRKEFNFKEAIKEYEKVIKNKDNSNLLPEATYNIGLCYTWLNDLVNADFYFRKVINEFANDPVAVSFAHFGLSWIKVQQGKYYEAIEIIENDLNKNECKDYEHNAVMMFQIGKIHKKYLHDFSKADAIFKNIITTYPNSKIIKHPFFDHLRNK
jgi:TolA-binding protein